MNLDSEKQVFSDFNSCSRRNVQEKPTREFFGLRHSLRDDSSTKPLRFDSSTEDRTYETAFAVTRQSHSTIRTKNCPNSNIYFCKMCTVDVLGTVTNSRNCSIFHIPVAMSSGEAEYISAATACIRASHLRMLTYDLKYLCTEGYDGDKLNQKPARIIIDNEAAICMAKCNKDTAGNRHVARRFHYVRQGTVLKDLNLNG